MGITDDQILLMLPTDHGCNPKNVFPGKLYNNMNHDMQWLCKDIEVDYKAEDLTEDAILNLMRGRYSEFLPDSKRLRTNSESKVFMFFNGHGGDNFFKIQDTQLMHMEDLSKTFNEMHLKGMYKEVLFIMDTCEGWSMLESITAPNLLLVSSSEKYESAIANT